MKGYFMELLFILYLLCTTLLIVHEIDSAYWKEWELFKVPGGAGLFVLIHIPIIFLILLGVVQVRLGTWIGLVVSLITAAGGLFAFVIHHVFLYRGRREFNTAVSRGILIATAVLSLGLIAVTLRFMHA
jgi:hypothetical protein